MQNIIIVFLIILPFIALVAWAASSKYGTFKILGLSIFLLFTGYGTGSYIWVNNFMLPQVSKFLAEDDNVSAWLISNQIDSFAPFFSTILSAKSPKIEFLFYFSAFFLFMCVYLVSSVLVIACKPGL